MPDWNSPSEQQADSRLFEKVLICALGIYAYDWLITLKFEWDILRGNKHFRWPLIFYFLNRYLTLFTLTTSVVAQVTTSKINCQALYLYNQLAGNAAVGLTSINLSIRTMAVWSQNIYINSLLVLVILGHWSLILQGVLVKVRWIDGRGCVITSTNNKIFAAVFIYSMCFDFLVLSLTAYKLVRGKSSMSGNRLANVVFKDGLAFFMVAFIANLIVTIFLLLDLNPVISVVFVGPAGAASTIAACRAVRRLAYFETRPTTSALMTAGAWLGLRIKSMNSNVTSGHV